MGASQNLEGTLKVVWMITMLYLVGFSIHVLVAEKDLFYERRR